MREDETVIGILSESDMMWWSVSLLGWKTMEEEEVGGDGRGEGVSVREKVGILRLVLAVVRGGQWRGGYSELENVVGRLEEEGKEGKEGKGRRWRDWEEMGRLAKEVKSLIEKKELEGEIVTVGMMEKMVSILTLQNLPFPTL